MSDVRSPERWRVRLAHAICDWEKQANAFSRTFSQTPRFARARSQQPAATRLTAFLVQITRSFVHGRVCAFFFLSLSTRMHALLLAIV